ncbi:MAG: 4Fe-4S binding protein [Dehalococcoidales bacterium]|nr:4Fe-4S binding protein [Dehalococcoidales bacterium]
MKEIKDTKDKCTLCRKCVGICRKTVGRKAIIYVESGNESATLEFISERCIACGSCSYICSDGAIIFEDIGDTRVITTPAGRMEFKLKKCNKCGYYWAPEKQVKLMAEKANLPLAYFDLCPDCRV